MSQSAIWMLAFFGAYLAYCIFMGVRLGRRLSDARSFFAPPGGIATWVLAIATTSALFGGLNFTGHPAQVFRDGLQYTNSSFFVITIPLAGLLVMKRQWLLAQRHGWVTPGEMYASYYRGETINVISAVIAVVFAVPFLATLFSASGSILQSLSGGAISRELGMWGLAAVVLIYSVTGGIGAIAQVGVVQGVLFAGGMIILGILALIEVGGLAAFSKGLAAIAASPAAEGAMTKGYGGGDYNGLFAVPGVIQWTAGVGVETAMGGVWTAVMGLSFALSMMGMQLAPGFSVIGFSGRTPRAFAISQVWLGAFCVGATLFIFSTLQGLAAHLLGADAAANAAGTAPRKLLPELSPVSAGDLAIDYIKFFAIEQPWLIGLLGVAAVAALQSTSAVYLATAGNIVSRDIYKHHLDEQASWRRQKMMSSIAMLILGVAALMLASFGMRTALVLATLAIPFAFQLLPALAGVLWLPWITRRAATAGLIVGLVVVVLTEPLGQVLTGGALPWGRWPWTIHSGVWGMFFNLVVCVGTVFFTRSDPEREMRDTYHRYYGSLSFNRPNSARMKSAAWIILLIWVFFGPGPGSVIGNKLFGSPGDGVEAWVFGVPSIWAWQVFWWALGVGVVWFLAERMRFSRASDRELGVLKDAGFRGGTDDR